MMSIIRLDYSTDKNDCQEKIVSNSKNSIFDNIDCLLLGELLTQKNTQLLKKDRANQKSHLENNLVDYRIL